MTILGFVVLSLSAVRLGRGCCQEMPYHPSATCLSHWPVLRNLGIGLKTPKFSCLLLIFHSFGQIWWRGQFQELVSFPTVFN